MIRIVDGFLEYSEGQFTLKMAITKINFKDDSHMLSVFSNILADCESRMPDLRIICSGREVIYTHKSLMVLFPVIGASLSASPGSDAVILDVKKSSLQDLINRVLSPEFTEADSMYFSSDLLQIVDFGQKPSSSVQRNDITEQSMETERTNTNNDNLEPKFSYPRLTDKIDIERNEVIEFSNKSQKSESDEDLQDVNEPTYHQEQDVVNEITDASIDKSYGEDDLAEDVTVTPDILQNSLNEDLVEEEFAKNQPVMGASRQIDVFLQKLQPKGISSESTVEAKGPQKESEKPVDDNNIDCLLADSDDEEIREPPRRSKSSDQNQELIVCPYPKLYCSKTWKKHKHGKNINHTKRSMKNHILKAHYENEFTRLLDSSFTVAGRCSQCKNKSVSGRFQQKKHLLETHKALEDEIAPLLLIAFPNKTQGRRLNVSKENSQLQASRQEDSSQIIEEIQSKLEFSDDSSDEEEIASPKKNKLTANRDLSHQITIDFSDSDIDSDGE